MKRIIGTVAALAALLAFSTVSNAAPIVFDVSATGTANTVSTYAPAPPGYFITPLGAGSQITVDITAGLVSLTSGILFVNATTPIAALGNIVTDVDVAVSGGSGVLSGDNILWTGAPTTFTATGSFQCTDTVCIILGLTAGVDYPIANLGLITGTTPVNPVSLGIWNLDATLSSILGSNRAVYQLGGATPPPGPGLPAAWYLFGAADLGNVPEPGALVLVALGLGALSLRSRKA